jgi:hypothetical protein
VAPAHDEPNRLKKGISMRRSGLLARSLRAVSVLSLALLASALTAGSALAVSTFTETFDTDASNWLDGVSAAPTWNASGGVGDSGHISYLAPFFNSGSGGFGDPLRLMFRGNAADDASGGAFVGDWIADGVLTLSVAVRHNHSSALNLYTRIAGFGGAGASLANSAIYTIAPDTWTTITIPITDANPPFVSYGASNFEGVFSNVQNLQIGLYLPANTDFAALRMDLDDVAVLVPEPASLGMVGLGLGTLMLGRRRRAP